MQSLGEVDALFSVLRNHRFAQAWCQVSEKQHTQIPEENRGGLRTGGPWRTIFPSMLGGKVHQWAYSEVSAYKCWVIRRLTLWPSRLPQHWVCLFTKNLIMESLLLLLVCYTTHKPKPLNLSEKNTSNTSCFARIRIVEISWSRGGGFLASNGCGSKMHAQNGTLVNGTKDQHLRSPGG